MAMSANARSTPPGPPPHCTWDAEGDACWDGPAPGTAESRELAEWEVETGALVSRGGGQSCRFITLKHFGRGRHSPDDALRASIFGFHGAEERWEIRLRRAHGLLSDEDLVAALVQEFGGWSLKRHSDDRSAHGYHGGSSTGLAGFLCDPGSPGRGPSVTWSRLRPAGEPGEEAERRVYTGPVLLAEARRILGIPAPQTELLPVVAAPAPPAARRPARREPLPNSAQLPLL